MKAIVTRYRICNSLESTGDDMIFIHVFFRTDQLPEASMPVIFSLDELFEFISSKSESKGKYLKQIRNNITGYGPKHTRIVEIIEEEEFQLEPYIFLYVEEKKEDYLVSHFEWCKRLNAPENKQILRENNAKLSQLVNEDRVRYQIDFTRFQDEVDQALHLLTLKFFPSLFEMDQKNIEAYKDCLVDATLGFTERIDRILHNNISYSQDEYGQATKAGE
jgi:hypothetical protein